MGKQLHKVIFKPDPNASLVFLVIVNGSEYHKWKEGDTSIPLVEVVDSFDVLRSDQGPQGILGRPSKQELDSVFSTHRDDEVVKHILEHGKLEAGEGIPPEKWGTMNASRGSKLDNRGGASTSGL